MHIKSESQTVISNVEYKQITTNNNTPTEQHKQTNKQTKNINTQTIPTHNSTQIIISNNQQLSQTTNQQIEQSINQSIKQTYTTECPKEPKKERRQRQRK